MPDMGLSELLLGGTAAAADAGAAGAIGSTFGGLATAAGIGSSSILPSLSTAAMLTSMAGTGLGALQQMNAGDAAEKTAKYNATVEGQEANAAAATGEAQAVGQNQQTALLLSRARAQGAGSGAADTSGSIVADESQIQGRGDLNAMTDIYNGESRSQALQEGANLQLWQGQQAENAAPINAASTIMQGASSLYTRFHPNPFGM